MAKHSKRIQFQWKRAGRSVHWHAQHRMPKLPRSVESLIPEVEFRLRCVHYAQSTSVGEAVTVFRQSPATGYRW